MQVLPNHKIRLIVLSLMFPYLLFVGLLLFFYYRKQSVLMLFTMALFAVLRYDVGWDYMSYYSFSSDEGSLALARERYSVVWEWLFTMAHSMKMPHLAIAIPSLITMGVVYQAVRMLCEKDKEQMSDALLVYSLWPFFYLGSFSTIRQSLAVALSLLVFALLYKRKWLWAVVVFSFNFLVHPSSLLAICCLPFVLIQRRFSVWVALVVAGVAMWAISNWVDLVVMMDVEAFNEYVETYMDQEDKWGRLLSWLLGLVALFLLTTSLLDKKQSLWQNKLSILVAIALSIDVYIYLSGMPSVITRTTSYFSIFLMVVFYDALRRFPNPKLFRVLLTCALVMLFFIYLDRASRYESNFEVTTSSGFVPYKTILTK